MGVEGFIVSTAYFPPLGYVSALLKAGHAVIELHETYPKQTCRNHACIYSPNGRQTLSFPVNKPEGNHSKTKDIRIAPGMPWQRTHWRSIEAAYSNSPFFLYYQDYFRPFFEKQYEFLADVNTEILETLMRLLQIPTKISFSESYDPAPSGLKDLRTSLTAKHAAASCPLYTQTFSEKHGFIPNLSILDLIFNLGPESAEYLDMVGFAT